MLVALAARADRVYIMNSSGYNTCETQLSTAIANNGHTVVVNTVTGTPTLPTGFTSTCIDSVNGYDYLCFFGTANFSSLLTDIQAFIDVGGKVFYQYEVSCCTQASSSVATILSGLTGLGITTNSNSYIALASPVGWEAVDINCCVTIKGNAYKGLDGLPVANQLEATANLNSSTPAVSNCTNFGCFFHTTDFVGTANKGGFIGLGDYNAWHDGDEPFSNGGSTPVNTALVNFFFPNDTSTCYLFPPGCLESLSVSTDSTLLVDIGNDTTLCNGDSLLLDATTSGSTYVWQDGSTNSTMMASLPGIYWVTVTNSCEQGQIVSSFQPKLHQRLT